MNSPRIYIACLSAYNKGKLHGLWVDCVDVDTVQATIETVLSSSPEEGAEEYAIHDHEGFGSFMVGEHEDIEDLCKLGAAIDEHGLIIAQLHAHLCSKDIDSTLEYFEENRAGEFTSDAEFARSFLEDTGALNEIPENLRNYFDYEAYGRDMDCNGDMFSIDGVYFWNR